MTLEILNQILTSPAMRDLLAESVAYEGDSLRLQAFLRRQAVSPAVSQALAELAELRRRGRAKFSRADRMFFTKQALEQATCEAVATHRARRFEGLRTVADLCCGIGGDSIALARYADVLAVDRDIALLKMARENASVCDAAGRIYPACADVTRFLARAEAYFIDPSRRVGGRRVQGLEEMSPPLSFAGDLLARCPRVAVKLSPAADYEPVPWDGEVEIVSEEGEAKEAVLWLADFKSCRRRATLLPSGASLTDEPVGSPPVTEPGGFLYEPDAAVLRARLTDVLAARLGASPMDKRIPYLTANDLRETPFADAYRIEGIEKLDIKTIRRKLRKSGIGRIAIKKRGVDISPPEFAKSLALEGPGEVVLVVTRLRGRPYVLFCSPVSRI